MKDQNMKNVMMSSEDWLKKWNDKMVSQEINVIK